MKIRLDASMAPTLMGSNNVVTDVSPKNESGRVELRFKRTVKRRCRAMQWFESNDFLSILIANLSRTVHAAALPKDPTLYEVRAFLAPKLAAQAAFDGWNEKAVASAAGVANVDANLARLAFNDGAVDMIDAWFMAIDEAMVEKNCRPKNSKR